MKTYYLLPRKSWYKMHELRIWLIAVIVMFLGLLILLSNPMLIWDLTTPIVKLMGGQ